MLFCSYAMFAEQSSLCSGFVMSHLGDKIAAGQAHSKLVATAVSCVEKQGLYYQCNFAPDASYPSQACEVLASVKAIRPGHEMCEEAHGLMDPMRTSLLLLGRAGRGTPFHVDRTQAENIAFPVVSKSKVRHTHTCQTSGNMLMWSLAECMLTSHSP